MVIRTKFCRIKKDWVQPPMVVDVLVKGISIMKFDCSLDSNVFFMGVAFISESL